MQPGGTSPGTKVCAGSDTMAKAILAKYAHAGYPGNLVFPVIYNQKMNDYIKEIAELCGFIEPVKFTYFQSGSRCEEVHLKWEVLSTHAARTAHIDLADWLIEFLEGKNNAN